MVVSLPGGCFGRWAIGSWQPFQIPVQAISLPCNCFGVELPPDKSLLEFKFPEDFGMKSGWVIARYLGFNHALLLNFLNPYACSFLIVELRQAAVQQFMRLQIHIYIYTYRYISGGLKRLVILGNLLWVFVGVTKWWLVIISQFWIIAGSQICLFQSSCQLRMKNEIMIFPLKQEIAKIDHYRNPYHSTSTSWTMKSVRQHSVLNVSLVVSSFLKTSIQSCGSRISGLCPAITHYVARLHPVTRIHLRCIYIYIDIWRVYPK